MVSYKVLALCISFTGSALAAVPKNLSAFTEGERLVYTKLIQAYRSKNAIELQKQRKLLETHYPQSVHLDNAYYLSGVLDFENDRLAESIKSFGEVMNRFPKSNKRSAAMFAKAAAYRKLGLNDQAQKLWRNIIKDYPGSSESQRAWMQLRVKR